VYSEIISSGRITFLKCTFEKVKVGTDCARIVAPHSKLVQILTDIAVVRRPTLVTLHQIINKNSNKQFLFFEVAP